MKEAAKIYGCCVHTFYKKLRRGEIPGVFREPGKRRGRIKICPQKYIPWLMEQMATGCHPGAIAATHTNDDEKQLSTGKPEARKNTNLPGAVVKRIAKGVELE